MPGSIAGLVGPIESFLGLRCVAFCRALTNRALGCVSIGAMLADALASAAGWFLGWLLPIAGIAHLMYLAKPAPTLLPACAT